MNRAAHVAMVDRDRTDLSVRRSRGRSTSSIWRRRSTARNENPRRYLWKAEAGEILRKINAAGLALDAIRSRSNSIQIRCIRY